MLATRPWLLSRPKFGGGMTSRGKAEPSSILSLERAITAIAQERFIPVVQAEVFSLERRCRPDTISKEAGSITTVLVTSICFSLLLFGFTAHSITRTKRRQCTRRNTADSLAPHVSTNAHFLVACVLSLLFRHIGKVFYPPTTYPSPKFLLRL